MPIIGDIINMYSQINNIYMEINQKEENIYECIVINKDLVFNFDIITNKCIIDVDFKSFIPTNKNTETSTMCHLLSNDIFRDIADFIETVCINAKNIKNYCISCFDKLSYSSDIFTTCGGEKCKYKIEEKLLDNDVSDFLKRYPIQTNLIIDIANQAINSPKFTDLFDPFPTYFLKKDFEIERGKIAKLNMDVNKYSSYNSHKDFDRLKKAFGEIHHQVSKIEIFDDKYIFEKYGPDFYYLLRFLIKSCKLEISLDKKESNLEIFKIKNPFTDENKFKEKAKEVNNQTSFLFHGSTGDCWYSILRNGLKILSGSPLQVNGAAYGSGIYCSNNYLTSLHYCKNVTNPIVAVYEVVDDREKYKKVNGIYVVPSNDLCILRYLIVGYNKDYTTHLNTLFDTEIKKEDESNKIKMSVKGKNRLIKEIKDIEKLFKLELVNNSIDEWFVSNDKAILHIKFPSDYPFNPPFIYIKKPVFSIESKYITLDGAICLEYLTPSIWSPTYSMEGILVQIFIEIINNAIIKEDTENNIKNAILSYEKLAIGNGWIN